MKKSNQITIAAILIWAILYTVALIWFRWHGMLLVLGSIGLFLLSMQYYLFQVQYKQVIQEKDELHQEKTGIISSQVKMSTEVEESLRDIFLETEEQLSFLISQIKQVAEQLNEGEQIVLGWYPDLNHLSDQLGETKQAAIGCIEQGVHISDKLDRIQENREQLLEWIQENVIVPWKQAVHTVEERNTVLSSSEVVLKQVHGELSRIHILTLNAAIEAVGGSEEAVRFATSAEQIRHSTEKIMEYVENIQKPMAELKTTYTHSLTSTQEELIRRQRQEVMEDVKGEMDGMTGGLKQCEDLVDQICHQLQGIIQVARNSMDTDVKDKIDLVLTQLQYSADLIRKGEVQLQNHQEIVNQ